MPNMILSWYRVFMLLSNRNKSESRVLIYGEIERNNYKSVAISDSYTTQILSNIKVEISVSTFTDFFFFLMSNCVPVDVMLKITILYRKAVR